MQKTSTEIKKERSHINYLASKIRAQYPNLYLTAGSRYVRKIIRSIYGSTAKQNAMR